MFGYFTGAAKKAVSRRGKEPHKFRFARAPTRALRQKATIIAQIWFTPAPLHPSPPCAR